MGVEQICQMPCKEELTFSGDVQSRVRLSSVRRKSLVMPFFFFFWQVVCGLHGSRSSAACAFQRLMKIFRMGIFE